MAGHHALPVVVGDCLMSLQILSFFQRRWPAWMLLCAAAGSAAAAPPADADPLAAERWKTRPLVVVAPSPGDPVLQAVLAAARSDEGRRAFAARDMVLFTVVGTQGQRDGRDLSPRETQALLRALELPPSDKGVLVLVGKDGGSKLAQRDPVDLRAVYAEIDGMPMRQNEVKRSPP